MTRPTAWEDWMEGYTPDPKVLIKDPEESPVLGPNGLPLTYPKVRFKLGFDLTPKVKP